MNETIRQTLSSMEAELQRAPTRPLCSAHDWATDVPLSPGVYAVWEVESRDVLYVGETTCLRDRMRDMGRWENHICRRKLAGKLGFGRSDESVLSTALAERYVLAYLPVALGRVELEEYLSLRWQETLINSPSRRLRRGTQYDWVQPVRPRLGA
jgi:hypothetical protein